jgi:uncharacterized protein (TIGR03435 family)
VIDQGSSQWPSADLSPVRRKSAIFGERTETAVDGESMIEPQPERMTLAIKRTSMSEIAMVISRVLQTPVVDETHLKGRFTAPYSI